MKQVFTEIKSIDEALNFLFDKLKPLTDTFQTETIKVKESLGRVTAEPVFARLSSPSYPSAAMDGYAVSYKNTLTASERSPVKLRVNKEALYVDTGDPIPNSFDAVVMLEDVHLDGDFIEIYNAVSPYQHVRTVGEDIVATELIVSENHIIRPIDIGAMLAAGILEVKVRKKPVVSIIPTGTELIEPEVIKDRIPIPPEIIEYNSAMLAGLIEESGAKSLRLEIVKDDIELLKNSIEKALDSSDIVIVNAGSGKGSEDFTLSAFEELGEVVVNGVSMKPGKPLIIAFIKNKPVFGIPGYPVSAYLTYEIFVKPVIKKLLYLKDNEDDSIEAYISRQISSQLGTDEFIRVKVGVVNGKNIATPIGRGAGLLMTLVRADGLLNIPSFSEGYSPGAKVKVKLLRSKNEINNTLVCIGSHDIILDLLANMLKKKFPDYSMSSAHVGSMGGLIALKRGEAHIAGTHLLDEETGEYNIPYIKRIFPKDDIRLINLVYRIQGLVVKKGNPKNIKSIADLVREDVFFINRQAGSGTRILLDKCLKEAAIKPSSIKGYNREEYTHMSVASAVLAGIADAGLAIYSSAKALELDFIPIAEERYDLAIPSKNFDLGFIQVLIDILKNDEVFKNLIKELGGYDTKDMGKIIY
ncbi:MAG: molybdopterin biosynthesis protein [Thermodesulfovibrionales bacterium]|nr:molybdopterin biosynthesis protein [Thermodesulfovibrionales bacterium]